MLKITKKIFLFLFVCIMAFISEGLLSDVGRDKYDVNIKKYGTELERFSMLLEENIGGYVLVRGLPRLGVDQKKHILNLLRSINYKRDCSQGTSSAVKGGMSCVINGVKIDYTNWQNLDYNGY